MRDDDILVKQGRKSQPWRYETGIINLDDSHGSGTHWVAYAKKDHHCEYFDSYGNLRPPQEFLNYMSRGGVNITDDIMYNYSGVQKDKKYNCGHLCLRFLSNVCELMFNNKT